MSQDGNFYYVMELLDGWDLERFIRRYGPQPPARVCAWLVQICHSLREAHGAGLVHRDIKPSNVMVCRYGADYDFIKLLDFGLVSHAPSVRVSESEVSVTGARELAGTPAFMAPEIVMQDAPIEARTDLYAVGCVAYWLLTGRYVFEGPNATAVIVSHVHAAPEPPSTHTPSPVPPALERVVLRCLAKAPADRPASAHALLGELEALTIGPRWDAAAAEAWWREHGGELEAARVSGADDTQLAAR